MSSSKDMSSTYEEASTAMTKEETAKVKMSVNLSSDPPEEQYDKEAGIKEKIKISKLNANNYRTWAAMMKMNFDDRNFWKIVSGDVKQFSLNKSINKWLWKQNNSAVKTYILANIEKEQVQHVIRLATTKKQWDRLEKIHLNQGKTRFIFLINRLNTYKAKPDAIIDDVISEIQEIVYIITEIREKLESKDFNLALVLINAVNGEQYVMTKWQLKNMNDLIFINVIEKYKEVKQKVRDDYKTFATEVANKISNDSIDKKKFKDKCFHCNKKKHRKIECRQWLNTDEDKKWAKQKVEKNKTAGEDSAKAAEIEENVSNSDFTFMTFGSKDALNVLMRTKNARKNWIIDSNAIRHMTSNRDLFIRLDKQETMITVANGVKLKFLGRSDIAINLNSWLIRMTNILYVSNFSCNLLSIFALKKKDIEVYFKFNNIVFIRKNTRIAIGILRKWMYYLKSTSTNQALINQNSSTAASVISEDHLRVNEEIPVRPKEVNEYLMWHAWMGHAGPNRLLKAVDAVVGMNKKIAVDKDKCVICNLNKMTKMVNWLPPLRATKMLERVFSDYWGKYRMIDSKNKGHFLSFMNDYSKMSVVYIYDRSETKTSFRYVQKHDEKAVWKETSVDSQRQWMWIFCNEDFIKNKWNSFKNNDHLHFWTEWSGRKIK